MRAQSKKNKYISLLLIITMLCTCCGFTAAAEEQEAPENIWTSDFSIQTVGKVENVSGLSITTGEGEMEIAEDGEEKYLSITNSDVNEIYADKIFPDEKGVNGKVVIDTRVSLKDTETGKTTLYIRDTAGTYSELCHFAHNGLILYDDVVVSGMLESKFYKLSIVMDFDERTMDFYFNGKKRIMNYPFPQAAGDNMKILRIAQSDEQMKQQTLLSYLKVYHSDSPVEDIGSGDDAPAGEMWDTLRGVERMNVSWSDVSAVMKEAVALYVGKPVSLVKDTVGYIDADRSITPFYGEGENVMLPAKFFAQSIGATISFNAETSEITLKRNDTEVVFTNDADKMTVNGEEVILPTAATIKNGVSYIPACEACDALDVYLFSESRVIIYSDNVMNLSWTTHLGLLKRICARYVFEKVSGDTIIDMMKERWPANGHPRLIMTQERVELIQNEIGKGEDGDPYIRRLYADLKALGDFYLKVDPLSWSYDADNNTRIIDLSNDVDTRVIALSLAYLLTEEEKYAERALREMTSVCGWGGWNPYIALDNHGITFAMAMGYDWLYNYMTEQDRAMIRQALIEYGILSTYNDYMYLTTNVKNLENPLSRSWFWATDDTDVGNWRTVGAAGGMCAALAVADELSGKELEYAEVTLEKGLESIGPTILEFAPDGAFSESMGYWSLTCQTLHKITFSLLTACGTEFGYMDGPGTRETSEFIMAVMGPVAAFAYHDGSRNSGTFDASMVSWGAFFEDYSLSAPSLPRILEGKGKNRDLWYYTPEMNAVSQSDLKLDMYFRGLEIVSGRSSWEKDAMFLGFHSDESLDGRSHNHMDGGTFIIQAMGEEFFFDLGKGNYETADYKRSAYHTRAEGHNTILINPNQGKYDGYDMQPKAAAKIDEFVSEEGGFYAKSNLTDLYRHDLEVAWRGAKLDNNRQTITIQDELVLKEPGEFYWFAHTEGDIEISDDGKTAFITKNGKTLIAEITCGDGAVFIDMAADPLPSSPVVDNQQPRDGIRKLAIHLENVKELDLAVVFNCYDDSYSPDGYSKEFVPLAEWKIN